MTRVVCALSGGGAKAAAHLGVFKALSERGLHPSHYVATSMGGVVAALLASGIPYDDALRRLTGVRRKDLAGLAPGALLGLYGGSVFRLAPLRRLIGRLVPAERFADLAVPLTVTAVDLDSGELILLGEGGRDDVSLADALTATCALPIYFPPVRLYGRQLVDGGLRAVLPLEPTRAFAPDLVVGVDVGPSFSELPPLKRTPLPTLVRRHGQVVRVLMATQTDDAVARWRREGGPELMLVRPQVRAETTFAVELAPSYVEEGYRAAVRVLSSR